MSTLSLSTFGRVGRRTAPETADFCAGPLSAPRRLWSITLALLLSSAALVRAQSGAKEPQFKYVGGTEGVIEGCQGTIEVGVDTLTFRCAQYAVRAPYASITLMQYRSSVSRQVLKMKLKWKVHPPVGGGKKNRYFTVLFKDQEATHALVLEVPPEAMQPYLAEIDLQAGKRVEVMRHEDYE